MFEIGFLLSTSILSPSSFFLSFLSKLYNKCRENNLTTMTMYCFLISVLSLNECVPNGRDEVHSSANSITNSVAKFSFVHLILALSSYRFILGM